MVFATHMADQTRGLVRFVGDGISVFRAKRVKDADETVTDSAGDETPATEADRQRLMRLIDNGGNRRTVEQVRFDIDASEASPDRTTGADRPSDPPE